MVYRIPMNNEDTLVKTIKLDDKVHARLAKHGTIGQTYQDVIVKLLDYYESGQRCQEMTKTFF